MEAVRINDIKEYTPLPELEMDESTKEFLSALEQRISLQLKPIEQSLSEIRRKLDAYEVRTHALETDVAILKERANELKKDLDNGLEAVRVQIREKVKSALEDGRYKVLAPAFAAVASICTILGALLTWWLKS